MANLPDEIWRLILESGVKTWRLSYRDVCCISISSRRLRRLANEDSLWSMLLAVDFPAVEFPFPNYGFASSSSNSHPSPKFIYKTRFEREKEFKLAAHRRAVLRLESQMAVCSKDLGELRRLLIRENERMKATELELKDLEKVRQASVSLNVWQPATVRSWQKQIVEQSSIPVEQRINALEMELKVCKKQSEIVNNAYNEQKRKLKVSEEELASLKYHPTRDYRPAMFLGNYRSATSLGDRRGKKLKQCNHCYENYAPLRRLQHPEGWPCSRKYDQWKSIIKRELRYQNVIVISKACQTRKHIRQSSSSSTYMSSGCNLARDGNLSQCQKLNCQLPTSKFLTFMKGDENPCPW